MSGGTRVGGTTVAWFHCFAGIAGDMALGSLLDAGADLDEVVSLLGRLGLSGWELTAEPVLRGGIAATRAVVSVDDRDEPAVARPYARVIELVEAAKLPPRVAARSLAVFAALAEVEAALHRRPAPEVHFHEVGGHDALVDVVGTAAALEVLGVDEVAASPVAVGTGTVASAHGILPNPAPATVRLLAAAGAPTFGRPTTVELTTPTGAALLAGLGCSFGPLPPVALAASGFGAGAADLPELPNCVQVVTGQALLTGAAGDGQPVVTLEANVDDVTGEQLAHALAALLEAGAHDAWVTPVVMKKGRPGHTLHALADPSAADRLRQVLRTETGSFGVRATRGERWPAARTTGTVEVDGHPIAVKASEDRAKPEFDDVSRVAAATGRSTRETASLAEEAWRRQVDPGPDRSD